MTTRPGSLGGQLRRLLSRDRRRVSSALRHPSAGAWIGAGLPLLLVGGVLVVAGPAALPPEQSAENMVVLGLLIAAPVSFVSYGFVFRPADGPFLARLGLAPEVLFWERALRLLAATLAVGLLALLPYLSAGAPIARPFAVAAATAAMAWASALLAQAGAALAMSRRAHGQSWGCLTAGIWDAEVARSAPLVYAPVLPLLAGAVAAGVVGAADGAGWGRAGVVVALSAVLARRAVRPFALALPRFGAQVQEMAFAPPAPAEAGEFRVRGGIMRLLPRRAAAVWVRDGLVAGRRYAWAARVTLPVALLSFFALARWGGEPATRSWVALAVAGALLLQGAAIVGLGRMERAGPRWIDHSAGITWPMRFLGRWGWGWGLAVWLCLPVALAWHWWSGAGPGWHWVAAGGVSAGLAAGISVAAAETR